MSEVENTQQEESQAFNLHSIFNKKPEVDVQQVNDVPKKKVAIKKEEPVVKEKPHVEDKDEDDEEDDSTPSPKQEQGSTTHEVDYKAELEKLQKSVKDTQRSFHEDRKKLAAYKKAVEKMKEEGALLDDEANMLLDHTKFDNEPEEEPLFIRYGKVWDKEIEYMRKYASNPKEIDQNISAFQHFMQTASSKEIQDTLSDLSQYEEDEVEFTRQMLEIGRQYNEDIYADIHEAGSIRNLKAKYSKKEAKMQKEIDNLKERVNTLIETYEDYDKRPGNYKLPTGSGHHTPAKEVTFDPKAIFGKQFQGR